MRIVNKWYLRIYIYIYIGITFDNIDNYDTFAFDLLEKWITFEYGVREAVFNIFLRCCKFFSSVVIWLVKI